MPFGAFGIKFVKVIGSLFGVASTSWQEGDCLAKHVSIGLKIFLIIMVVLDLDLI